MKINNQSTPIQLIFVNKDALRTCLHPEDLLDSGTPIDPDTGEDLEYVGWTYVERSTQ